MSGPAPVRGRQVFRRAEPVLRVAERLVAALPPRAARWLLTRSRRHGSVGARALRYVLLRSVAERCGTVVDVREAVYLLAPTRLSLGSYVSIHPLCYLDATGGIEIGSNVSIAHASSVLSTTHRFDDHTTNIRDQPVALLRTVVEDDVWIGAGVRVLAGVRIGRGAVVGAGAVVTRDVPPHTVVAGVPATVVKSRGGVT